MESKKTIKDNFKNFTQVEVALFEEIVGLDFIPYNTNDQERIVRNLKHYYDDHKHTSAKFLFDKLVDGTEYDMFKYPIIENDNRKLVEEVNRLFFDEYDKFVTIVSALSSKYAKFFTDMLSSIAHEEWNASWGKKYTRQIVNSLGDKDLLIIILFCTDELTDKAIEYYMKDL